MSYLNLCTSCSTFFLEVEKDILIFDLMSIIIFFSWVRQNFDSTVYQASQPWKYLMSSLNQAYYYIGLSHPLLQISYTGGERWPKRGLLLILFSLWHSFYTQPGSFKDSKTTAYLQHLLVYLVVGLLSLSR